MSNIARALVVPGFAKCGTTMLHHALGRSPGFAAPKGVKETQFFLRPKSEISESGFRALFAAQDVASGAVLCDITPQYATFGSVGRSRAIYERIAEVLPNAFILLCFRHPIRRAFSHYIHDLQTFARFGAFRWTISPDTASAFDFIYNWNFKTAFEYQSSLNRCYTHELATALEIFGAGRVMPFFLESDAPKFGRAYGRLRQRLGLDPDDSWDRVAVPRVLEGNGIPMIWYGGEGGTQIGCGGREYRLPANALYVCTGLKDIVLTNVHPHDAGRLISARRSWTREVTEAALRECQRRVLPDMETFRELLLRHYPDAECPDYREVSKAPLKVGDCAPTPSEIGRLLRPI